MIVAAVVLAVCAAPQDTLIERGADWRYLDDGSDQGTLWREPQFNDSLWPVGPAEHGYGDGDEATVVSYGPDPARKYITTYFRSSFSIADPSVFAALEYQLKCDDGAVLYLNGEEVFRTNIADGSVGFRSRAGRERAGGSEESYFPFYERPSLLVAGVNSIAVEVHQATEGSADCSFDLEVTGHRGPSIVRGPYVQMTSATASTIRFRTIAPAQGAVRYGSAPTALNQLVSDPMLRTEHELRITGLLPNERVYYSVGTVQGPLVGGDEDHWFETAPEPGSRVPFRAWVLGDCGTYDDRQRRVRDAYHAAGGRRSTDLMLLLGDNAYRTGTDQEYQLALFDIYGETMRNAPAFSTRGNHELNADVYFNAFTLPEAAEAGGLASGVEDYYSFDWANVHFVCLDSWGSDRSMDSPMYRWCKADLQSSDQDWIVAFFHHPPYSKGSHNSDLEDNLIEMRETFLPLLEGHGVALVLSGHSHTYERSVLLDGHYGTSSSYSVGIHAVDAGLGRQVGGLGAYERAPGPHGGAVYVVAGNAGRVSSGGKLNHPAMVWTERRLGSVTLDVAGGRMDVSMLDDQGVRRDWFTLVDSTWDGTFCIGSVNSDGCVARLAAMGEPSLSSSQPFTVEASQVNANSTCMLFYGLAPSSSPFSGGRLCIDAPIFRTPPGSSGGVANCSGTHSVDFSALFGTAGYPGLDVGARVICQLWYRDMALGGSSVSEALEFVIVP